MTINMNGKSSLVILAAATVSGGLIFAGTKVVEIVKNKKAKKDTPEPEVREVQVADDAPIKKMAEEK